MEFDKKLVGNRIKSLRQESKMTQESLALLLGLKGKSSIANYESGRIIPSDKIKLKLCDIFNCPIDYLMGLSDDRIEFDYDEWGKKAKENDKKINKYLKSVSNKGINEILSKSDIQNYDKDEEEFKYAYHKEMEGLTDEEIADALRFYKEMKKKMKGDK